MKTYGRLHVGLQLHALLSSALDGSMQTDSQLSVSLLPTREPQIPTGSRLGGRHGLPGHGDVAGIETWVV